MPDKPLIACIGWGSLIWKRGSLPCAGPWQRDGPELPVEFARESGAQGTSVRGDRITLVICPSARRVRTFWVRLDVASLAAARTALATREHEKADAKWADQYIGYWEAESGRAHGLEAEAIQEWGLARGISAAVWTNLPCGLAGARNQMPSADTVVAFLRGLPDKSRAEEYVRNAPVEIRTDYREVIERDFGWLPTITSPTSCGAGLM